MKEKSFDNYEVFKKEVENLKKRNEYFFADAEKEFIYTPNETENFLSFYLEVLVKIIAYNNNDLTSFTTTHWYFYLPKSFKAYSKKDLEIMLNRLGYNFNDYDQQFTDKIGVIY